MQPLVGIIMGSRSDWATMSAAAEMLEQLGVPHEVKVVSAHRTRIGCLTTPAAPRPAACR